MAPDRDYVSSLKSEIVQLREALKTIEKHGGHVCPTQGCDHDSCNSSLMAMVIANTALTRGDVAKALKRFIKD